MRNYTVRSLIAIALAFAFNSLMFAAPLASPMLANASNVTLNHARAASGAGLRVGDLLNTADGGSAVLRLDNAQVNLGALTAAAVETNALRLQHGYLRVSGPLTVDYAGLRAVPAANSNYEMLALASGRAYLRVYTGSVKVTGLGRDVTVPAGGAISYQPNAAAGQAPMVGGGGGMLGMGTVATTLVVAGIAIGTIAAVHYATKTTTPASPSQP